MAENLNNLVYSKQVLDFVSKASDFCSLLESTEDIQRKDYIFALHKLLPDLYSKAIDLPRISSQFEEVNEKFVSEQDYDYIKNKSLTILGQYDEFFEVYDEQWYETDEPVTASVSEHLADIYQDLKDFLTLYNIGTLELMNDAIWECKLNFEEFWGQKLVNTLRSLHNLNYHQEISENDAYLKSNKSDLTNVYKTDNWIISKRQKDYNDDE